MANRTSYLNAVELRDGQVLLFNRPNAKKNVWHMRLYVRGMEDVSGEKVKYYTRSTGELDIEEAKRVALDTHDKIRLKVRNEEPVYDATFSEGWIRWWEKKKKPALNRALDFKQRKEPLRESGSSRVEWYIRFYERYWEPYFGTMPLTKINGTTMEDYLEWRDTYWERASKKERHKYPNHSLRPSKKTLQMERSALREFFGWACNTARLMRVVPDYDIDSRRGEDYDNRRPSFDKRDWQKLDRYMREVWVKGKAKGDNLEQGRPHKGHLFQREMVRRYCQFLTATGMRPTEPLYLKHRHIEIKELQNGKKVLEIKLTTGKTGARDIVSLPVAVGYYEAIKEATGKVDPEDWVFCDKEGKRSKGYYRTLEKLLKDTGLRVCPNTGKNRTAYSFRHYYAEQRLTEAGANLATTADLRANMGTSIQQIERHYIRKKIYNKENLVSYREPTKDSPQRS